MKPTNNAKHVELDLTLDEIKSIDRDKIKRTVMKLKEGLIDERA